MTASKLLERLQGLDIRLFVDAGRLSVDAAAGVLDDELRNALRACRDELIGYLGETVFDGRRRPALRACEQRSEIIPLSHAQARMWVTQRLDPDSGAYNLALVLRLDGALDIDALAAALGDLVARHEILRTRFPVLRGEPHQIIDPAQAVPLPVETLAVAAVTDPARMNPPLRDPVQAVRQRAGELVAAPFDLSRGPVLRATLLRLDEDAHVLVLAMHHIVTDGWSFSVLTSELG